MGILNKIQSKRSWRLKEKIFVLFYAFKDNRTPFFSKLLIILSIIYLVSPVDLIPDFIPIAGWLDDLVIVPLLFDFSFKLLPESVKEDSMFKAARHRKQIRILIAVLILFILLWLVGIIFLLKNIFA